MYPITLWKSKFSYTSDYHWSAWEDISQQSGLCLWLLLCPVEAMLNFNMTLDAVIPQGSKEVAALASALAGKSFVLSKGL